jgi:hypothetical protein
MRHLMLALLLATAAGAATLPAEAPPKGSLETWARPGAKSFSFVYFERGQATRVGVAREDRSIEWEKNAGIRPIVQPFWSADGKHLLVVTDCSRPDAQLRSLVPSTASWLLVLDAATGDLVAQGDLDTDVLDLPRKLPEAVGAAHELDHITLQDGVIKAEVRHRGEKLSGEARLDDLRKKHPAR